MEVLLQGARKLWRLHPSQAKRTLRADPWAVDSGIGLPKGKVIRRIEKSLEHLRGLLEAIARPHFNRRGARSQRLSRAVGSCQESGARNRDSIFTNQQSVSSNRTNKILFRDSLREVREGDLIVVV